MAWRTGQIYPKRTKKALSRERFSKAVSGQRLAKSRLTAFRNDRGFLDRVDRVSSKKIAPLNALRAPQVSGAKPALLSGKCD
jgi:hypothetical protein